MRIVEKISAVEQCRMAFLERYGGWCIAAFSLAVGAMLFALFPFPKRDPLVYLAVIRHWVDTGSYAAVVDKYPKFGLLTFSFLPVKWGVQLGLPLWPVSIVWMLILNAVTAWAFYRIVVLLTADRRAAFWCGLVFSFHPAVLRHAGLIMRDTPYLMACMLCVLCLIYSIRERRWYMELLTGAFCALAILCRYEALELLILLPTVSIFYFFHDRFPMRDILRFCGFGIIGFVLSAAALLLLTGDPLVLPARFCRAVYEYYFFYFKRW